MNPQFIQGIKQDCQTGQYQLLLNNIPEFQKLLRKISTNEIEQLLTNQTNGFNPSIHVLPFLYLLEYKREQLIEALKSNKQNVGIHLDYCQKVTLLFNNSSVELNQLRFGKHLIVSIAKQFCISIIQINSQLHGVKTLANLLKILRQIIQPNILTVIHFLLIQLCVKAKQYSLACNCLDTESFVEVASNNTSLTMTAKEYLLFNYFSAVCYINIGNLPKSQFYLWTCITIHTNSLSAYQVAAFKKLICVNLILKNKIPTLDRRVVSGPVLKFIERPLCDIYLDLGTAFTDSNFEVLTTIVNQNQDEFVKDRNLGLVKHVVVAAQKYAIINLTKIYTRLSINDLSKFCQINNPDHLVLLIEKMVTYAGLNASIDEESGTVIFQTQQNELIAEERMTEKMTHLINHMNFLSQNAHQREIRFSQHPNVTKLLGMQNIGSVDHPKKPTIASSQRLTTDLFDRQQESLRASMDEDEVQLQRAIAQSMQDDS